MSPPFASINFAIAWASVSCKSREITGDFFLPSSITRRKAGVYFQDSGRNLRLRLQYLALNPMDQKPEHAINGGPRASDLCTGRWTIYLATFRSPSCRRAGPFHWHIDRYAGPLP
jgi:hypothetical protein